MDKELEILARQVLCTQLSEYGGQREYARPDARLLIRARSYLEETIKARMDPSAADPVAVDVDLPVLRKVYGSSFSTGIFDDMLKRHLLSLRAGKPTKECVKFFQLAEQGYDDALKRYHS